MWKNKNWNWTESKKLVQILKILFASFFNFTVSVINFFLILDLFSALQWHTLATEPNKSSNNSVSGKRKCSTGGDEKICSKNVEWSSRRRRPKQSKFWNKNDHRLNTTTNKQRFKMTNLALVKIIDHLQDAFRMFFFNLRR